MAKQRSKPAHAATTDQGNYAATRLFEPTETLSRQEVDIALAAELLDSGVVSEREISAALSDWSLHGSIPLSDHLAQRALLTAEQLDALRQRALDRVDRARLSAAGGTEVAAGSHNLFLATLERLDGSGRVAKLLGVTVAARCGDNDARVVENRYELIRKLGQGGLGRVWLARDTNLNRFVALKEISHFSGGSSEAIERFKNEAEITGRLDHPSIVPIYQLGEDIATKRVFYAMRFLGRSTLQDSIIEYHERREEGDEDPMLLRRLLTAFVNVCHAIGYAHSRKVIHRDLKPENVVIDSFGQVIVIDWGLAKVVDETSVESVVDAGTLHSTDRTAEGQVLGTPLYMAPEQAAGRLDELDYRTDIYGLGAILFAIVTGRAPHEKTQKEAVESGIGARGMISAIASGAVPSATAVNPDADAALDAICRKAMARRRYARYQQATELADEVARWMAGEPVAAHTETFLQRVGRWKSQHRRLTQLLTAAMMVVLVALTTLGMATRHSHLVETRAQFAQMNGDIREVESQFRSSAAQLAKNARFLASLPPVHGIVAAREQPAEQAPLDEDAEVSRLQTILRGMLGSNNDYLALSFVAIDDAGDAQDIARVERNPADPSLLRVVPASRLAVVKADPLAAAVAALEPGDVKLSLAARTEEVEETARMDRLTIATPVFSERSGKCFGMILIEEDINKQIAEVLSGLGTVDYELYVADGTGQVRAVADPAGGFRQVDAPMQIPNLPAEVAELLEQPNLTLDVSQEDEYLGRKFTIDPSGKGIFIFGRLREGP
jgi:eukaryotic-like serine/threonine-protein kinase